MINNHDGLSRTAVEILGYLDEHEDASDTTKGIRHWWIMQRLAEQSQSKVQNALNQLVDSGLIQTRTRADGCAVYENKKRRDAGNQAALKLVQ